MPDETTSDSGESTLDPRTQRARSEDMQVALRRSGGIYTVRGESGTIYRVDIATQECTCPDYRYRSIQHCKHIRRVETEIRNRTVPTPDGRLPEPVVADGGIDAETESELTRSNRIEGPIQEFDKHGRPTEAEYYRCTVCGTEAMRRQDLSECCPVSRR